MNFSNSSQMRNPPGYSLKTSVVLMALSALTADRQNFLSVKTINLCLIVANPAASISAFELVWF